MVPRGFSYSPQALLSFGLSGRLGESTNECSSASGSSSCLSLQKETIITLIDQLSTWLTVHPLAIRAWIFLPMQPQCSLTWWRKYGGTDCDVSECRWWSQPAAEQRWLPEWWRGRDLEEKKDKDHRCVIRYQHRITWLTVCVCLSAKLAWHGAISALHKHTILRSVRLTGKDWPAVQRLFVLLVLLNQPGRKTMLTLLYFYTETCIFTTSLCLCMARWWCVYRLGHSGSYTPPCCCNGYRCHGSHHKWMTGRCCCLGCSETWGRRHDRGRGPGSPDSDLKTQQPLTGTSLVFTKICFLFVSVLFTFEFSSSCIIHFLAGGKYSDSWRREKTSKLSQVQVGEVLACRATDWPCAATDCCVTHLYRYPCTASGWNSCSYFLCSLQRWTFHSSPSCCCSTSAVTLPCRGPQRGPLHRALIGQQTRIILYRCVTQLKEATVI